MPGEYTISLDPDMRYSHDTQSWSKDSKYTLNFINESKGFWLTDMYKHDADITKDLSTANTDISQILKGLRLSNPKNVILSYLNVNSIRNKFENLREIISKM